jgi:hypothetical protein
MSQPNSPLSGSFSIAIATWMGDLFMGNVPRNEAEPPRDLKLISTHWTIVSNPSRFVTCYGAAVRAYLRALLPTVDDADEVEQEFLLQVVAKGFPTEVYCVFI